MTLWAPCRKGCPDPYDCPDLPPMADRCPESRVSVIGTAANDPGETLGAREYPCLVLGEHDVHRDGMGTSWQVLRPPDPYAVDCDDCGEPAGHLCRSLRTTVFRRNLRPHYVRVLAAREAAEEGAPA